MPGRACETIKNGVGMVARVQASFYNSDEFLELALLLLKAVSRERRQRRSRRSSHNNA
jgi:hypothetical protein